jgi:hypothetical protein
MWRKQFIRSSCAATACLILTILMSGCPAPVQPGQPEQPVSATGTIAGHALYSGQSDHSGILISAESVSGDTTLSVSRLLAGETGSAARAVAAQATTGGSGDYVLSDLEAGTYTVYARSEDSCQKAVTTSVTVQAGRETAAADLRLTPTGDIAGKANLDGAASGNLGIVVFVAGTSYLAMAADDGTYRISGVPAGKGYTLFASKQGYDSATATVDVCARHTATANLSLPGPVIWYRGSRSDGTKYIPGYWKIAGNTITRTDLPVDSHDLSHPLGSGRIPEVIGGTTYTIGWSYNDGSKNVPCYWKTTGGVTTRTDLFGDGIHDALISDAVVDSSGTVITPGTWTDGTNWTPCYWADSVRYDLLACSPHMQWVSAICRNGGVIYLAGWYYDTVNNTTTPCYWTLIGGTAKKYDLPIPNPQPGDWSTPIWGVQASGNMVFVTGVCRLGALPYPRQIACYWTGIPGTATATLTELPGDGVHEAASWASALKGGTLYSDGYRTDGSKRIPCYWIGTNRVDLPGDSVDFSHDANTADFFWYGPNLYVTGTYYNGTGQVPCYWTVTGSAISRTDLSLP